MNCFSVPLARPRRSVRPLRGMTLIELLVAMSILAFIGILVFGAVDGMRRSRSGVERVATRYREGRLAMARMSRELQSTYLSAHAPIDESLRVVHTAFIGEPGTPASRLDFNSFSNRRLMTDSRQSDQIEIAYFGSENSETDQTDLVRRVAAPDEEPGEGGKIEVLATDIDLFVLEYLDPLTGLWREEWDSTSVVGEKGRLPLQVKITLVLNGSSRTRDGGSRGKVRLITKIPIPIQDTLNFALK